MSTVLTYVEAGAGIGVMSDSVTALGATRPLEFRPLLPEHTVDLVMVWSEADPSPPAAAFRKLVKERLAGKKLWGQRVSRAP